MSNDDLLLLARAWVTTNYGTHALHLLKAEEWLRRVYPSATEAMLLATVTHEFGGWPDADWVQAADSLSFLEVNIDFFLDRIGAPDPQTSWSLPQVRAKFDWMYQRIKPTGARTLATPLYANALQKWSDKAEELTRINPI